MEVLGSVWGPTCLEALHPDPKTAEEGAEPESAVFQLPRRCLAVA